MVCIGRMAAFTLAHPQACCALIRAVAGNDMVKSQIQQSGGIDAIVSAMQGHLKAAGVVEQVLDGLNRAYFTFLLFCFDRPLSGGMCFVYDFLMFLYV